MKYKRGRKVEVWRQNEMPDGAWRCAEIICRNGHNFTVKYDEVVVERVSRKSIRPCPPLLELSENWSPGDVVEVFHNLSWKMAMVSKVLGRTHFMIRLVGSSQELKVSDFDLRMRQSWQDGVWIVIRKGIWNSEDGKCNERSTPKYNQNSDSLVNNEDAKMNIHVKDQRCATQNSANFQEYRIVSSGILKRRSHCCYSHGEAHEESAQKFRVTEKEGRRNRETTIRIGPNEADNVTSSVGSCSITSNNPYELPFHLEDIEGPCSEAESSYLLENEEGICLPHPVKEELGAEIHRLELHAYRCTIGALHASGPLSWEREMLLTDLRILLHISNDEHMMELRNLVSIATSIPIS